MDYNQLYKKVETYVTDLFDKNPNEGLVYHDLSHTKRVVARVKEIASHYNLIDNDMMVLFVAAWFHDVGYLFAEPAMHEQKGVEIMKEFMQEHTTDDNLVKSIEDCILATRYAARPTNLLQEILADADTFNLGTKEFETTNKDVYKEYSHRNGHISKFAFNTLTLKMLEKHSYYTEYCKEMLNRGKKKNIKKIKKSLSEQKEEELLLTPPPPANNELKEKLHPKEKAENVKDKAPKAEQPQENGKQLLKDKNNLTTKGIQTMLRLTSENHMRLSDMADGKANILISVNAIIISVILSVLLRRLQVDTYLTIPTVLFLASSVCTIVVAILATRPKINTGTFSDQDIMDKTTNLLFFGNFYRTTQEQYEQAMSKMMVDSEYLYSSLVKDIYQLGVVLARKYRLIRYAYNIFMVGIVISVLAFGLAVWLSSGSEGVISNAQGTPL